MDIGTIAFYPLLFLFYLLICVFCMSALIEIDKKEKYIKDYPQLNENGHILLGIMFLLSSPLILIIIAVYFILKALVYPWLFVYKICKFIYEVLRDGIWNE